MPGSPLAGPPLHAPLPGYDARSSRSWRYQCRRGHLAKVRLTNGRRDTVEHVVQHLPLRHLGIDSGSLLSSEGISNPSSSTRDAPLGH
jgi:hypothetical protein